MTRALITKFVQFLYRISLLGAKTKYSFVRYAMYKSMESIAPSLPRTGKVLSISHSQHLCDVLAVTPSELVCCDYPAGNILDLPYEDNTFDYVLSDQVFEHIQGNPQQAMNETLRVLKPGGYVVHTTCMMTGIHGPGDYWRFTPEGLALLCQKATKIVAAKGWGHPLVPLFTFLGFVWSEVPETRWHPIHFFATLNRDSYPFVVWIIAQK